MCGPACHARNLSKETQLFFLPTFFSFHFHFFPFPFQIILLKFLFTHTFTMDATQPVIRSRGLDWDVDQPAVRIGSTAAAVLSLIALLKYFPDHEKSLLKPSCPLSNTYSCISCECVLQRLMPRLSTRDS